MGGRGSVPGLDGSHVRLHLVGALLQGSCDLVFSSHWVTSRRPDWIAGSAVAGWRLLAGASETSLWLRKK